MPLEELGPVPAPRAPDASGESSCLVEVALPLRVNQKWVSYACRTAGVAKPRWSPVREVWTSSVRAEDGIEESIVIAGSGEHTIRIRVEWQVATEEPRTTATAR